MATVPNGYPIDGGDFPALNLSALAIPAFAAVVLDVGNVATNDQCMTVTVPLASGIVTKPAGITQETIPIGKTGRVRALGASKATASGAVAAGDIVRVESVASHMGQVKLASTGEAMLGQCILGGADGTEVLIRVNPGGAAP